MDVTVEQIANWARSRIGELAKADGFGTLTSVCEHLAKESGLSVSWITKFYQRPKINPTKDTLDRLVAAIKATVMERAA